MAVLDVQLVHHFAQGNGDMQVARLLAGRLRGNFAQPIVHQHEAAMGLRPKFRQTNRLRPDIEANETRRYSHR